MLTFVWPIALVVFSNVIYHICEKSVPSNVSPFAVLTVTYAVGAFICLMIHVISHPKVNIIKEFGKLNWAPFVLGLVIVGLEVGWIYAYKAGWQVSVGSIVQSSFLAIALIIVGFMVFKEDITWNKLVGIGICLVGLVFINFK